MIRVLQRFGFVVEASGEYYRSHGRILEDGVPIGIFELASHHRRSFFSFLSVYCRGACQ